MDFDDDLTESFEEIIAEALPGAFVSHYIIIVEVQDPTGPRLTIGMSDGVTPWLAVGMVESALDMVINHGTEE